MNRPSINKIKLIALTDIDGIVERLPKEYADNAKRQLRTPLLSAFDSYKTSIIYEEKYETYEEKQKILSWKQKLLDLETKAFQEIPKKVEYYIR